MQKLIPHLWYDREAREAAEFYTTVFPESEVTKVTTIRDTPSGDCDIVTFRLCGQSFMAISAGPLFKFTPAISFLVACETPEEVDRIFSTLTKGGKVLMPLDSYPFSERYGWTEDKYGLSWQVMYAGGQEIRQRITPVLMFVGDAYGKAEEAMNFYTSVFDNSKAGEISRYGKESMPDREGSVQYGSFELEGQEFGAMDSARVHDFGFNESISILVNCDTQEEIDFFWKKLSAVPEAEQCGWLKDKYGVSWQISPAEMEEMMNDKEPERLARVTQAFLSMKKFDLAELRRAYDGVEAD